MSSDHDIVGTPTHLSHGWRSVMCRCQRTFTGETEEVARARHDMHFQTEARKPIAEQGIEQARAALRGRGDDAA